jgi:hypothetical protein
LRYWVAIEKRKAWASAVKIVSLDLLAQYKRKLQENKQISINLPQELYKNRMDMQIYLNQQRLQELETTSKRRPISWVLTYQIL